MTLIGQVLLERYQVIEKIGEGGFGHTYLAKDLALPNHPKCVVKHLSPQSSSPNIIPVATRLFEEEAHSLYSLGKHDRIPTLYAHFCKEEQFYLVQELIEGNNLDREIIPECRFSEVQTLELLQELLEVLDFVHKNHIIHRDIKPANIIRRKKDNKLVLIDFGAVKRPSILSLDASGQTTFTVAIGSPGYMPSEQSNGKPKLSSDIYAVGIIAIQALTGLSPDQLKEDRNTGEIVWRANNNSQTQANLAPLEISEQLAAFIDRMVRYDYRERFQDATEALNYLKTIKPSNKGNFEDTIIKIDEETVIKDFTNPASSQTKKKIAIATSIVAILATIGGIFYWQNSNTAKKTAPPPNPIEPPPVVDPNPPQKEIDFSQLEQYLAAKEWQKADRETDRLRLKIAGKENALDPQAIDNFDCESLRNIDLLWLNASNGRFGFSVQRDIYEEVGNVIGQYNETEYEDFGNRVSWRVFGNWKIYSNLTWRDYAPLGHLPSPGTRSADGETLRTSEAYQMFDRATACGL